jgi:hypothetical protein
MFQINDNLMNWKIPFKSEISEVDYMSDDQFYGTCHCKAVVISVPRHLDTSAVRRYTAMCDIWLLTTA